MKEKLSGFMDMQASQLRDAAQGGHFDAQKIKQAKRGVLAYHNTRLGKRLAISGGISMGTSYIGNALINRDASLGNYVMEGAIGVGLDLATDKYSDNLLKKAFGEDWRTQFSNEVGGVNDKGATVKPPRQASFKGKFYGFNELDGSTSYMPDGVQKMSYREMMGKKHLLGSKANVPKERLTSESIDQFKTKYNKNTKGITVSDISRENVDTADTRAGTTTKDVSNQQAKTDGKRINREQDVKRRAKTTGRTMRFGTVAGLAAIGIATVADQGNRAKDRISERQMVDRQEDNIERRAEAEREHMKGFGYGNVDMGNIVKSMFDNRSGHHKMGNSKFY